MNRLSLLIGWLALTFIAIGVSSAAVGSVGERVSPQPASVLEAAGDVVALGAGSEDGTSTTRVTAAPSSTIVDPEDAATAPPASTSTTVTDPTTPPTPTTTTVGASTTTTKPGDTTTTTVQDGTTTTTIVDATTTTVASTTTTTTTSVSPSTTTTTIPEDDVKRRTIDSKGGWIRIAWTDEWLRLGAAGPRIGFKLEVVENTGERIVVRFVSRSLDHVSRIIVRLSDGDAKVEVSEFSPDP